MGRVNKQNFYKDEITKRFRWALENPTILTVSALQDSWIDWVEMEILPAWNTDLEENEKRMKFARTLITKTQEKQVK